MQIRIRKSRLHQGSSVTITGSKSESNRLLLLQALFPSLQLQNLSNSDDTRVMHQALTTADSTIDIHHAGTAMRFLTAYFATQEGKEVVLTGSSRMKERPIAVLVEALKSIGADIQYLEKEGCPPLKIKGRKLTTDQVALQANVSSQYISALLLVAPKLTKGLRLILEGEITSLPYIKMTLNLLDQIGVSNHFEGQTIAVQPYPDEIGDRTIIVESDWSSASYYFSMVALSPIGAEMRLASYLPESLQGDAVLVEIYKDFGVRTTFSEHHIILEKVHQDLKPKSYNLKNAPDIAQTIAVTCLGLGISCDLTGLHTLKIKETDRLEALKKEIQKLGGSISITKDALKLAPSPELHSDVSIDTYNDHRMAMAFAPLGLRTNIQINDAEVVSKSYPEFWQDLRSVGFNLTE